MPRLVEVASETIGISGFQTGVKKGAEMKMDYSDQFAGGVISGILQVAAPNTFREVFINFEGRSKVHPLITIVADATGLVVPTLMAASGNWEGAAIVKGTYNAASSAAPDVIASVRRRLTPQRT